MSKDKARSDTTKSINIDEALSNIQKEPANSANIIRSIARNETLYSWAKDRIKTDGSITSDAILQSRTQTLDFVHDFCQAASKGKYSEEINSVFLNYLKLEDVPFAGVERNLNLDNETVHFLREKILNCPDEKSELALSEGDITKRLKSTCKKDFELVNEFLNKALASHLNQHYNADKFLTDLTSTTSCLNPNNKNSTEDTRKARTVMGEMIKAASNIGDETSREQLVKMNGDLKLSTLASTASIMQSAKPRTQSGPSTTANAPGPSRPKARSAEGRLERTEKKARRRAIGRAANFDPQKLKTLREQIKNEKEPAKISTLDPATGLPMENTGAPPPKKPSKGKRSASTSSESSEEQQKEDTPTPNRPRR